MFDTMKVAKKIREARITQNMTQLNLADAMEVSYQAVSNWERGGSMPDISKLEQLCQILNITLEELLGADNSKTLSRIQKNDDAPKTDEEVITLQEIQDVAPLLPPVDVKRLVDKSMDQQDEEKINLSALIGLAPFLDGNYLDNLVRSLHVSSLHELTGLAPFLDDETLNALVMNTDPEKDMSGIISLAPFLSEETLDKVLENALEKGHINLAGLYPFLSQESLQKIAESFTKSNAFSSLAAIAPFL